MDYITTRDPADCTEIETPHVPATQRRLHDLYHELKYWHDDLLLGERALTDPDHAEYHDEIRNRMAKGHLEVERLEFEIRVAELKSEVETNHKTIELHEAGLRACNKRIIHLLNELDDVRSEREYRQSDECRAGLTFNQWNRIELGFDSSEEVVR